VTHLDLENVTCEELVCDVLGLKEGNLRFVSVDWDKASWDSDVNLEQLNACEVHLTLTELTFIVCTVERSLCCY